MLTKEQQAQTRWNIFQGHLKNGSEPTLDTIQWLRLALTFHQQGQPITPETLMDLDTYGGTNHPDPSLSSPPVRFASKEDNRRFVNNVFVAYYTAPWHE